MCKICGKRRPKRYCPAVEAEICAVCCGTERETTLTCPLQCEYLRQAHRREHTIEPPPELPNLDVEVSEQFVSEHEELTLFAIYSLLQAALRTPGAIDADVLAAIAALIQTHRTLDSGLVYETRSENPLAANIQRGFTASFDDYQKLRHEREGLSQIRNAEILKTLVFLQRLGLQNQNGKPKGRMFLDLLRHMTPDAPTERPSSPLVI